MKHVLKQLGLPPLYSDVKPGGDYWETRPYAPYIPDCVREIIWAVLMTHLPPGNYLKAVIICAINDMIGGCPPFSVTFLQDCARDGDSESVSLVRRLMSTDPNWVKVVMEEAARVERVLRCWKAAVGDLLNKWFPRGIREDQRAMVLTNFQRARKHLRTAPDLSLETWNNRLHAGRAALFQKEIEAVVAAAAGVSGAPQEVAASAAGAAAAVSGVPWEVAGAAAGVSGAPQEVAASASASAAGAAAGAAVTGAPQAVGIAPAV